MQYARRLAKKGFSRGRSRPVTAVVLHYVSNPQAEDPYSTDAVYDVLEKYGVAAHYIVSRPGVIYNAVDENDTAWHAGESELEGEQHCNNFTIGIELIGSRSVEFTAEQYLMLGALLADIRTRHEVPINRIVGHEYIAYPGLRDNLPEGKPDPGPRFNWSRAINLLLEYEGVFMPTSTKKEHR